MAALIVPDLDEDPWPTLGGQICDFIEERAVFGPGSLKGVPAVLDREKRAAIYRAYEVFPQGHPLAGRRRFKRICLSWRKGTAKTEWAAWLAYAELHPEAPIRCDGFDADGEPVGRPVRDPYIPLLAYTEEQTEDLAYAALFVVVTEGPDADLFDAGLDRIIRLDDNGKPDGKATALAGSPNARDGARTTFQHFDEPHRMVLPKLLQAHETMSANLPKRPLEDPWSLYTTTAGELGEGSVAELLHNEAQSIAKGEIDEPELFYLHRQAGPGHDLTTFEGRLAAIEEATGPVGEYGPGQFRDIAKQWDRPGADLQYLERVWLNRWLPKSASVSVFPSNTWESAADAASSIVDKPKLAVTMAPDSSAVVLAAAGRRADGDLHVEIVLHGRPGRWFVTETATIAKAQGAKVALVPSHPAGSLVDPLEAAGVNLVKRTRLDYQQGCGALYNAVADGTLHYPPPQPELDAAVARAIRKQTEQSWRWSGEGISALVAASQAVFEASKAPVGGKGRVIALS